MKSRPTELKGTSGDYFKPENLPTAEVILLKYIAHLYLIKISVLFKICRDFPFSGKIILCKCVLLKMCSTDVSSDSCKRVLM